MVKTRKKLRRNVTLKINYNLQVTKSNGISNRSLHIFAQFAE